MGPADNTIGGASIATSFVGGPPRIAITMGSDSDKGVMEAGAALLRRFGIPYESNITSAHRTVCSPTTSESDEATDDRDLSRRE